MMLNIHRLRKTHVAVYIHTHTDTCSYVYKDTYTYIYTRIYSYYRACSEFHVICIKNKSMPIVCQLLCKNKAGSD